MANQTVKNGLKAIVPIFHSAKFKKNSHSWSRVMRMCHFRAQNSPFVLNKFFFRTSHYYYFHLPIDPFHCVKFRKILTADAEFWRWYIFRLKMVYLPQTTFFWKFLKIILIRLLAPFNVQNFKKNIPEDPELRGCAVFVLKMAHFPKWDFFQKIC